MFPLLAANILSAVFDNDLIGFLCILVLLAFSVYAVTVIFLKFSMIRKAQKQSKEFEKLMDQHDGTWEMLYQLACRYPECPSAKLLKETYIECQMEGWFEKKGNLDLEHRLELAKNCIESVLDRTIIGEERRLSEKLIHLSTVGVLAPFIGLFGTVWGILGSFQALGREGSAALASLAPGISTALTTTIFGLIAAIPAVLFFNILANNVQHLSTKMNSFSGELLNEVRRHILRRESGK